MKGSRKKGYKDYSKPVSFIGGEIQQAGKKTKKVDQKNSDEDEADEETKKIGFGYSGEKYSSESSAEEGPSNKPHELAGMRRSVFQPSLSNKGK